MVGRLLPQWHPEPLHKTCAAIAPFLPWHGWSATAGPTLRNQKKRRLAGWLTHMLFWGVSECVECRPVLKSFHSRRDTRCVCCWWMVGAKIKKAPCSGGGSGAEPPSLAPSSKYQVQILRWMWLARLLGWLYPIIAYAVRTRCVTL